MYLSYFSLREPPFNLTPDPKFFYDSAQHREALASLYYGIKSKKGFIVVTGEVGAGKTTLLRKLLRSLEATHHSVFIFNTLLTFDELLEYAVRDLGMQPVAPGRAALIQQLNEFLLEKNKCGHIVCLLIDEAQQLSEEALEAIRFLSNLETDSEKLIQIILVGQPELEEKLNKPSMRQLKQRVSIWTRLDRLKSKETEAYIRHRLAIAGYQGPSLFDASSVHLIHQYAAGTPRLINSICDNALLTAFAVSSKVVAVDVVKEVVQDLNLTRGFDVDDHPSPEVKPRVVLQPRSLRSSPGIGDPKPGLRVRSEQQPEVAVRGSAIHATADFTEKSSRRPNTLLSVDFSDRELKRTRMNDVSVVASARDLRAKEQVIPSTQLEETSVDAVRLAPPERRVNSNLVPREFLVRVVASLADAMGPMASVVLREHVARFGESLAEFPLDRVPELVAALRREILSEQLRAGFDLAIREQLEEYASMAGPRSFTK